MCKGAPTNCLRSSRWAEWLQFADATGLQLVLGLNACFGRQVVDYCYNNVWTFVLV